MKKLLSLAISLGLLAVLYWKIDVARLGSVIAGSDPVWMTLSLSMVVPLTMLTAWRLQLLMPKATGARGAALGFGEANRLILLASVLNLVLPSKMGDLAKAWFMRDRAQLDGARALALVVFEKTCDMLSLLLWGAFGLALYPQKDALFWLLTAAVAGMLIGGGLLLGSKRFAALLFELGRQWAPGKLRAKFERLADSWNAMHASFWSNRAGLIAVATTSVFIWFLHLVQIWMFTLALRATVPFLASLALSPLAILAGLLPLTFAGVGTRDGALVFLYAPYFGAPTAAVLGLLCTARYVLPAMAGLPFAGSYLRGGQGLERPVARH